MGLLVDGQWRQDWYEPDSEGRFRRPNTHFRGRVRDEPNSPHPPQSGRYHLYVSLACPWAHRTLITRARLGLEGHVGLSVVDPHMGDDGWAFSDYPGCLPDPIHGAKLLRDVYLAADPRYTGRVTTPVLWDRVAGSIVNNESREIMRMLDCEFTGLAADGATLVPPAGLDEVDHVLDALYEPVNNGVYRAGFATTQEAYEEACTLLFEQLDRWENRLATRRYLCGDVISEADVAMYVTLIRFDLVYYSHFKCNVRRIRDYPNLWNYLNDLYGSPGFGATTDLRHIKVHYYWSQTAVNPTRVVPLGPDPGVGEPHDRGRFNSD